MRRRWYEGIVGKEGRKRMETCRGTYDDKKEEEEEEGRRESTRRTKRRRTMMRRGTRSNRRGRGG